MAPEQKMRKMESLCLLIEQSLEGNREAEVPVERELCNDIHHIIHAWRQKGWQVISVERRGETVLLFRKEQEFLRCPTTPGY